MKVKCLTYSRFATSIPIYTVNKESSNLAIANDAEKVIVQGLQMPAKVKALRTKIGEREKLRASYGIWYATHDQNDICYAVCTAEDYPQRHAFGLIARLQDKIKEIDHCEYETEENVKVYTKKLAEQLAQQYNDLNKVDKVAKATSEVKILEGQLNIGIKKLVQNQSNLSQLDEKADRMKSYSNEFHQNSEKLEKLLYWRNCKLKIIVALCIIGLLGFVILLIVMQQENSKDSEEKKLLRFLTRQ